MKRASIKWNIIKKDSWDFFKKLAIFCIVDLTGGKILPESTDFFCRQPQKDWIQFSWCLFLLNVAVIYSTLMYTPA